METSMYYTFSTIAQVLAALVALGGVFLIFKIQELKDMMLYNAKEFVITFNDLKDRPTSHLIPTVCSLERDEIVTLINAKSLHDIPKRMQNILDQLYKNEVKNVIPSMFDFLLRFESRQSHYDFFNVKRHRLIEMTKKSVKSGISTILFSVIVLPFTPIICWWWLVIILFLLGIFGISYSIYFMRKTILDSLDEHQVPEVSEEKIKKLFNK